MSCKRSNFVSILVNSDLMIVCCFVRIHTLLNSCIVFHCVCLCVPFVVVFVASSFVSVVDVEDLPDSLRNVDY